MGVYKRGPTWWVRFTFRGQEIRRSAHTSSKAEALRVERELREQCRVVDRGGKARRTFDAACERWIEEAWPALKPGTIRRYGQSVAHLERAFSGLYIDQIDRARLAAFVSARRREGVVEATIRRDLAALSAMMSAAIAWDWIDVNPVSISHHKTLRESRPRVRFLRPPEMARLLAECHPRIRPLVEFAAETGMRAGEIFALEWRNVDLDRAEAYVCRSKVGTPRTVPLSPRAVAILRSAPRHLTCPAVFWRGKGRFRRDVPRSYRVALKRAGINDFTFHDLRHHFASMCVQAGMDLYRLGRILGHTRTETTQRYAHLETQQLHDAMRGVGTKSAQ